MNAATCACASDAHATSTAPLLSLSRSTPCRSPRANSIHARNDSIDPSVKCGLPARAPNADEPHEKIAECPNASSAPP